VPPFLFSAEEIRLISIFILLANQRQRAIRIPHVDELGDMCEKVLI
jgi:hypothetical protein